MKLAIYQFIFVVEFIIYAFLLSSWFELGGDEKTVSLLIPISIAALLLFPSYLVLFILLRRALKESIFRTIIACILFFIPICREICCITTIVRSIKILNLTSMNEMIICISPTLFKKILSEDTNKTPKRIWLLTKVYAIIATVILIPFFLFSITEQTTNIDNSKDINSKEITSNGINNSYKGTNGFVSNSNSSKTSFFEENKDILIPAALLFIGAAMQSSNSQQTNYGSTNMTCLSCGGSGLRFRGDGISEHCPMCGGTGFHPANSPYDKVPFR